MKAIITVTDSIGRPIDLATVRLYSDRIRDLDGVASNVSVETLTFSNGQAEFDFKLEAILRIEARKDTFLVDGGFIVLVPGETTFKTVKLN